MTLMSDRMVARDLHEAIIREKNKIFDWKKKGIKNGHVDNMCILDVSFVLDLITAGTKPSRYKSHWSSIKLKRGLIDRTLDTM